MKSSTMAKGCLISIVICMLLIVGFFWAVLEAFGTKIQTVEIDKPLGKLICQERYDADFGNIFYDIDFKLVTSDSDTLNLGKALYHESDWTDRIKLLMIDEWYCISAHHSSYATLGLANKQNKSNISFTFSPLDLREDSLWREFNKEIPEWDYSGSSIIESIDADQVYVEYAYRLGSTEPFSYKKQRVLYQFDTKEGQLVTKRIFPAVNDETKI